MKQERRFLNQEIVIEGSTDAPKITGYASVFLKKSHDLGNFREIVDPKAFDACLAKNPSVLGLFNHSNDMVLGATSSGTLKLSVDEVGLKYEIDPPNTSYANDLLVSMKRGDIRDASFGFYAIRDKWHVDTQTNENIRTILQAEVFDVSVVSAGAYPDANSQVRALFPEDKGQVPEVISAKIAELRTAKRKEKRGRNVLAAVAGYKWAIMPDKLETICSVLNAWAEGHVATKSEVQAAMMGYDNIESISTERGVAVLPIYGTIGQKMNMMTEFSGGFSCEKFTKDFRTALADDSVTAIVFDIDSPGGTVTGVPELAAEIFASRGKKPIVAVANGMAASAALWIATAADQFFVIPSGDVGSIGVYTTHQDVSVAMEKAGVSISFIKAGPFKTEGNPYEPASAEFFAYQQKGVDEIYQDFLGAVALGRGVSIAKVAADYGQGRMLSAKDALAVGLVDDIATLDQIVAGLSVAAEADGSHFSAKTANDMAAMDPAMCDCGPDCAMCSAGSHAECPDCDFDEDDEDDDEWASTTGLDVFISTIDNTDHYFRVTGKAEDGSNISEELTKEQYDAWVAEGEAEDSVKPVVEDHAKTNRAVYLAKIMSMFS